MISGFGQLTQQTMRRDLERRLRAVEVAGSGSIEIWVHQGGGTVRGPRDEHMTFEKARHYGALSGQSQSSSAKWTYAFDFERRLARAEISTPAIFWVDRKQRTIGDRSRAFVALLELIREGLLVAYELSV